MAYRADIEIGVKGVRSLEQLRSSINLTATAVDSLNEVVGGRGGLVQSIQNYINNVATASRSLKNVGFGDPAEIKAIREQIRAIDELNTAVARQKFLTAGVRAESRTVRATSNAGYGQQMPALPPAMVRAREVNQSWSAFFRDAMDAGADLQVTAAAKNLNIRTSWNKFFTEAAQAAQDLQSTAISRQAIIKNSWGRFFTDATQVAQDLQSTSITKQVNIKSSWNRFFTQAQELAVDLTIQAQNTSAAIRNREGAASAAARQRLEDEAARRRLIENAGYGIQGPALPPARAARGGMKAALRGRAGGAISSAIIGGGFPLLFGQGAGAAAGGALGGLAGGLLGGQFGFALSIAGTAIADLVSQRQKIKQLGQDIGFSAEQTNALSAAFRKSGADAEKFTAVVQNIRGLGLELKDQSELIKLTSTLTEKYGGEFDKVGNAITSALESGKVGQSTLNQLTSQGINIQQALADKLGVSRDRLLEMAKKGQISVQDLVDTLVEVGNAGSEAVKKPASGMELLGKAAQDLGRAIGDLGGAIVKSLTPPLNWLAEKLAGIISLAAQGIQNIANLLSGGTEATVKANAKARQLLDIETGGKSKGQRYLTPAQTARLDELQRQQQQLGAAAAAKIKPIDVRGLGQAAPSGTGSDKAARDAARLAEQRQKQLEDAARLAVSTDTQLKKAAALTEEEKLIAEVDQQRMERMTKYETLYKNALSNAEIEYLLVAQLNEINAEQLTTEKALLDIALEQSELLNKTDPLAQAQEELNLLHAKLTGKEEEYTRQQAIDNLVKQGVQLSDAIAQVDVQKDLNDQLKERNAQLQMQTELFDSLASNVASAFSSAINAAVQGTEDLGAALNNIGVQLLGTIGNMLIMYGIAQALGAAGGGVGNPQGIFSFLAKGFGFTGAKDGAYWSGGFQAFADGGMVTRPTMGLIGEGGEAEYVIPASKMRGAMNRYAAGARGSAVIPAGDGGDGTAATVGAAPGSIDVRYTVERINSVDYVTADQFQRGMQQAASQGAAQGEQRTLRRLQMSTSTRKRLGM